MAQWWSLAAFVFFCLKGSLGTARNLAEDWTCPPGLQECPPPQEWTCPKGQHGTTAMCEDCEPGKYSTGKQYVCTACPSGKFADQKAMVSCQACPDGLYAPSSGSVACGTTITTTTTTTITTTTVMELDTSGVKESGSFPWSACFLVAYILLER
mmetsp:Transcript_108766/g.208966  ORF Transcript_108766/g.208966 Transcript_108766/m.208966 type:complete len:154 (-) Transcript_108766:15-476(-)